MSNQIFGTDKKFNIIYADPPWQYSDRRISHGGAKKHYKTMPLQDICDLPVEAIADDNCMLFLWTTSPMIFNAQKVIEAWGFDYKTMGFVWVKCTKDGSRVREDGIGNYTMQNAEYCLIALKGKYWRNKTGVMQILLEPRTRHSSKPACVRERIVELCGDLPRIELFARERVDGWECWGNEVPSHE